MDDHSLSHLATSLALSYCSLRKRRLQMKYHFVVLLIPFCDPIPKLLSVKQFVLGYILVNWHDFHVYT